MSNSVNNAEERGSEIDYITFVPDGEPTLDFNLGKEISLLRTLGKKIAVITNASLIARDDVKEELNEADLVSVKIDTVSNEVWRYTNRPVRKLSLMSILP